MNFRADVDFSQLKGVKPHELRRVSVPVAPITFPLLSAHLKVNDTLEGRQAARQRDLRLADGEKKAEGARNEGRRLWCRW